MENKFQNAADEIKELTQTLNKAAKSYYQDSREIMSDYEYDALYDKLVSLENLTGIILSSSPTQKVGFDSAPYLKKAAHETPLLSLNKTKQISDLESFLGDREGLLSWKLDGLTVVLKYTGGRLVQALTRGNGQIGEDVTHNALFFKNIPLKIPYENELVIRGEAVISYPDFFELNESLPDGEKYKNPRNLCSGTVRQLDSKIFEKRNVNYFAFGVIKGGDNFSDKKSDVLLRLEALGFGCVESVTVTARSVKDEVSSFADKTKSRIFASDGLVLTFNSADYSKSLGQTSKFPRDSIAFKWKDEVKETKLSSVEWNTSRTGLINPVAVFEPVELEGTTVNRASIHNVSIIEGLELGIGDTVKVYKANMIIPQIADNLTRSGNLALPDKCPVCGEKSRMRQEGSVKVLRCENINCRAQLLRALTHFVSRDGMNIEGLSDATVAKFLETGYITAYPDIFKLDRFRDGIMAMDGFGLKSYENLRASIEKSKTVKLFNFIYALGITHVGLSNAKLLCRHFSNDLNRIIFSNEEELASIEGYGAVISESVHGYFSNKNNTELLNEALLYVNFETEPSPEPDLKSLSGLTFVITGDLISFKNRKEAEEFIEARGGKAASSVTSKTSYLINNDTLSASSKNRKAKELGVPVITEDEFVSKYS